MRTVLDDYPTLDDDLRTLLGEDYSPDVTQRLPTRSQVEQFADQLEHPTRADLTDLHTELLSRYDNEKVGSLMDTAILGRDRQLQRLSRAGPDTVLDMLAEGYFLPRIAKMLDVSHAVMAEFVKKTIPETLLAHYESLAVDRQVDNAMENLEMAAGRDDVQQARAFAELTLKVAKARSGKWVERKPVGDTYVQQNFGDPTGGAGGDPTSESRRVVGFQLILRDPEELKPMKPVPQVTRQVNEQMPEDPLVVNGEFRPIPTDD